MALPSKTANRPSFRETLTDLLAAMREFCRPHYLARTIIDHSNPAGF
jgi:hypothetical protein